MTKARLTAGEMIQRTILVFIDQSLLSAMFIDDED
jgi:hypothetical protein